jgi:opine dehydrogenase
MNQQMHAEGRGGFGPTTVDSRYIYEDVPFGLVPTSLLGRLAGKPTMLHDAGIAMMSAATGHDLPGQNDLLPALGIDALTIDEVARLCDEGY